MTIASVSFSWFPLITINFLLFHSSPLKGEVSCKIYSIVRVILSQWVVVFT